MTMGEAVSSPGYPDEDYRFYLDGCGSTPTRAAATFTPTFSVFLTKGVLIDLVP
jgi:hypothetical protein